MKGFIRQNLLFSLCGLNCGLCPMQLGHYCPGCGGGAGNQPCAIARCSIENAKISFCFECPQFPCSHHRQPDPYDSFITHRNRLTDLQKAQEVGIDAYTEELLQKRRLLLQLLEKYNDGRKKALFCTAANLLPLPDLQTVIASLKSAHLSDPKARAALAASLLQQAAEKNELSLQLRKKPSASRTK